ncbi:MAG: thiamine diphosphokinase [Lachnospiraceae bacterium]|nr:thiamine diphosphokinase [Lachnospiraceae bacterium]
MFEKTASFGAVSFYPMTNVIFIFSGGTLDDHFAEGALKQNPGAKIIAADRGLEAAERLGIRPDFIIGDFDSASEEAVKEAYAAAEKYGTQIRRLNPVKDDTDTEAAVKAANELYPGPGTIYILGGTGTRLDHVLGNLSILGMGYTYGKDIILMDPHNRARMYFPGTYTMRREDFFGTYVSFFPIGEPVAGLTLSGFKYPLSEAVLHGLSTLAVSNEAKEEEETISFRSGRLLMIESKD